MCVFCVCVCVFVFWVCVCVCEHIYTSVYICALKYLRNNHQLEGCFEHSNINYVNML